MISLRKNQVNNGETGTLAFNHHWLTKKEITAANDKLIHHVNIVTLFVFIFSKDFSTTTTKNDDDDDYFMMKVMIGVCVFEYLTTKKKEEEIFTLTIDNNRGNMDTNTHADHHQHHLLMKLNIFFSD